MLITIGNVGFSKKGKKTFLSYGSLDTTSKYTYSCDMKQWVLVKIEEKGLWEKISGSVVAYSYNEHLTYDVNGNILTLLRYGEDEEVR